MAKVEEFKIAGKTQYRIELTEEEMDLLKILMLGGITNKESHLKRREPLKLFNELSGGPIEEPWEKMQGNNDREVRNG